MGLAWFKKSTEWQPIDTMPKKGFVLVTRYPDWKTQHPEHGFMRTFCKPQYAHWNKEKERIELKNGCPVFQPLVWKHPPPWNKNN